MKNVYLITTGHSPREDISDDLREHFSDQIIIHELGALDDYSVEEVEKDFAPVEGESALISRMRDGTMKAFSEEKALPLVQKCIDRACSEGADEIIILCTSEFPQMKSSVPILFPGDLEHVIAKSVASGMKVSYLFPFATHAEGMAKSWADVGLEGNYSVYHHSSGADFEDVIRFFKNEDPDIVILDCMGYSYEMAEKLAREIEKPIVLPRALLVNVTHSLLGLK